MFNILATVSIPLGLSKSDHLLNLTDLFNKNRKYISYQDSLLMFFINFQVTSNPGLFHLGSILGVAFRGIELSLLEEIIFHFLPRNKT